MPRHCLLLGACALLVLLNACAARPMRPPERPALMVARDAAVCPEPTRFEVGAGQADITGPASEVHLMGYVNFQQVAQGIHQRLRSRAFVIASPCSGKRVVFVSADLGMLFQAVKQGVLKKLEEGGLGELYRDENVLLSATHTHAGPSGYSHYGLYTLSFRIPVFDRPDGPPSLRAMGYVKSNYDAIVDGIYQSIVQAHRNLAPGRLQLVTGELDGASANRSREAYALNAPEEREGRPDVDTTMTLLRLETLEGQEVGVLNWFAVHPTSMSNANKLISGDNKGYASYLFERRKGTDYAAPRTFVAAFAQSNEGDVTPFVTPRTGTSRAEDFEATRASGEAQFRRAWELYEQADAAPPLPSAVDYRHLYVKLDEVDVAPDWADGEERYTCKAAIGVSMLAGAEDGPGIDFIREGVSCKSPPDVVTAALCSDCRFACHQQKPVVLSMGRQSPPLSPEVLPLQLLTLGELAVVAVPFEMTTMAGRKLREVVRAKLAPLGVRHVVIAGLSNAYAGYLTTRAEYSLQHYEGASTHFGPWALDALRQEFSALAEALATGTEAQEGPRPRVVDEDDLPHRELSRADDVTPPEVRFGDVIRDANAAYVRGRGEREVVATFWSASPRNHLRPPPEGSFMRVERRTEAGWTPVARDWDWETTFEWEPIACDVARTRATRCSRATLTWMIPEDAAPGTYRLRHDGVARDDQGARPFTGTSREFTVE